MKSNKIRLGEQCVVTSSKRFHLSERITQGVPFYCSKEIIKKFNGEDGHLAQNPQKYVLSNLKMMKAKLETYKYQMNAVQLPKPEVSNSQVVNVTNSMNVNITFEQVRKEVEEMTSLTNEQTQEVLDKISEIEEVVKSKDSKKSKWEKVKPVLAWMADKSCDVGIALLPLLLKIGQQ